RGGMGVPSDSVLSAIDDGAVARRVLDVLGVEQLPCDRAALPVQLVFDRELRAVVRIDLAGVDAELFRRIDLDVAVRPIAWAPGPPDLRLIPIASQDHQGAMADLAIRREDRREQSALGADLIVPLGWGGGGVVGNLLTVLSDFERDADQPLLPGGVFQRVHENDR